MECGSATAAHCHHQSYFFSYRVQQYDCRTMPFFIYGGRQCNCRRLPSRAEQDRAKHAPTRSHHHNARNVTYQSTSSTLLARQLSIIRRRRDQFWFMLRFQMLHIIHHFDPPVFVTNFENRDRGVTDMRVPAKMRVVKVFGMG